MDLAHAARLFVMDQTKLNAMKSELEAQMAEFKGRKRSLNMTRQAQQQAARCRYGNDPADSIIRIAPTYPFPEEPKTAMQAFPTAAKLATAESLL